MKPELVNPLEFSFLTSIGYSIYRFFYNKSERKVISKKAMGLGVKAKCIIAFAVISLILFSFFAFAPNEAKNNNNTPQNLVESNVTETESSLNLDNQNNNTTAPSPSPKMPFQNGPRWYTVPEYESQGIIESAAVINSAVWKEVAVTAWLYFQPGAGVNLDTGLPNAGTAWPYFTGWDLGVYIQAILDARKIGLIEKEGYWGVYDRIDKVLTFLENRKLTNNSLPYWWYQTENGNPYEELHPPNYQFNVADSGRLLVALKNLKTYNNSYTTRIENIINRTNYSVMLNEVDTLATSINIYDYFVVSGFAGFWPEKANVSAAIIDNIMSAPQIDLNGARLPISKISCEPILLSIFELEQLDPRVMNLSKQVYLAHEGFYNETGQYRAFSEGPTTSGFAYEWVVLPDGRTWVIQNEKGVDLGIVPIIYTKVAFSFLALHNTTFARDIVVLLEKSLSPPCAGYYVGMSESEDKKVETIGSNTNGLIISAARYAIQKATPPETLPNSEQGTPNMLVP